MKRWMLLCLSAALTNVQAAGAKENVDADIAALMEAKSIELPETLFCKNELRGELHLRTELFFGRNKPGGKVSEAEFQAFIGGEVTPRFPNGFTVLAGKGQFRNHAGVIDREDANVLIVQYPYSRSRSAAVDEIRATYKRAFYQDSVLRMDEQSCVSF